MTLNAYWFQCLLGQFVGFYPGLLSRTVSLSASGVLMRNANSRTGQTFGSRPGTSFRRMKRVILSTPPCAVWERFIVYQTPNIPKPPIEGFSEALTRIPVKLT